MNRVRRRARLLVEAAGTAAVMACAAAMLSLAPTGSDHRQAAPATPTIDTVKAARAAVHDRPTDPTAWSQLGLAEFGLARATFDTARLSDAERAFQRSLALRPQTNYDAVVGLGMVANSRHEFAAGWQFGQQATRMAPDRAAGYAVLADAGIQLGDYPAATAAAQRLLDLAPTVAAFTRAAYDLQTHGRSAEAVIALQRGLESANNLADVAFCEYRLGDLAWDVGDLAMAAQHYRRAAAAVPGDPHAQIGQARVDWAQGRANDAAAGYAAVVERTPLPKFLLEYAELLHSIGRYDAARSQLAVLDAQVKLANAAGGPVDLDLALYLADHGDPETAVQLLRGEWDRRKSVLVADALAWALHRADHSADALTYAHQAGSTGWRSALFAYHRGAIEMALGQPQAAAHLREALDLNPHFSALHAPQAADLLASPSP